MMFHILCTYMYTRVHTRSTCTTGIPGRYVGGVYYIHVCCKKTKKRWVAVVAMGAVMCDVQHMYICTKKVVPVKKCLSAATLIN